MTRKEARNEALRICCAVLNAQCSNLDFEDEFTDKEEDKVRAEIQHIADSLYNAAVRLGGDFNENTGYEHGKKISI